jgi:hypothetical protein
MAEKKSFKVLLVTPTLDGKVTAEYALAATQLQSVLYSHGINFQLHLNIGNSLLASARNKLADDFLSSNADYLLMVDSDIAYRAQDVLAALPHLDDAIVAFPCSKKFTNWDRVAKTVRNNPEFPAQAISAIMGDANFHLGESDYLRPNEHGLAKVKWIGTGIMMTSRKALEKIIAAEPENKTMAHNKVIHEFFRYDMEWEEKDGVKYKGYSGEDVSFCVMARKAGVEVYAKLDALTTHSGFMTYRFDATAVAKIKKIPDDIKRLGA